MNQVDPASRLGQVEDELNRHLGAVLGAAYGCPPGGGRAWDQALAWYGVQPLPANERVGEAMGRNMSRGAVPREVTRVLDAIAAWALRELDAIAPYLGADPRFAPLRHRVCTLSAFETGRYEAAVMPPAASSPSVGSIFANASATAGKAPWAMVKVEPNSVLVCMHCGAPQQRPLDFVCKYCRKSLAGTPATGTPGAP